MRGSWWRRLAMAAAWLCVCAMPVSAQVPQGALRGMLGANKPDLLQQYLGLASSADGSPSARYVTRAMAEKSLADARDIGFGFVRIMAAGYGPVAPPPVGAPLQNDLALWQSDPPLYWQRVDRMFAALDAAGIRVVPSFVWNPLQFPVLANETLTDMIVDGSSASRALLQRYIAAFITRYRARPTILFYELTNELNLEADLDLVGRCLAAKPAANCAGYGNFTTAQMERFADAMVRQIRKLDPTRLIGSGYSLPRPGAFHLAAQPEFSPNGPDWTADSPAQFRRVLIETGSPFDLWSVHIYPGDVRWGNPPGSEALTLRATAETARRHGKRAYLGEFGDSTASPYYHSMLHELSSGRTAFASVWVWEFYQQATWLSADLTSQPATSLEPGFTDGIDGLLEHAAGGPGTTATPTVRVVLTTPLPCAALSGPTEIYATASASGPIKVDGVDFLVDGKPVGGTAEIPFHMTLRPNGTGMHRIDAIAHAGDVFATTRTPVVFSATDAACSVP